MLSSLDHIVLPRLSAQEIFMWQMKKRRASRFCCCVRLSDALCAPTFEMLFDFGLGGMDVSTCLNISTPKRNGFRSGEQHVESDLVGIEYSKA